ncbi:MAG TPA: hypothetical protein VIK01_06735, partial [Polyangiaceae bacterium]
MLHGEQTAILGVEHEDETQKHGEEPVVEVVTFTPESIVEESVTIPFGCRLEAAKKNLERLEDLLGKVVRHVGLPLPTLGEQRRERSL